MENKYCEKCEKMQETICRKTTDDFVVKDRTIRVQITICVCKTCGEEVWDENVEKENERIVFGEYRKQAGLLQPEDIKSIRDKYGLTQTTFAALLGFGAKTITRYENGSIQDMSHDNLIRLMNSYDCFSQLWEIRKTIMTPKEITRINRLLVEHKQDTMSINYKTKPSYRTSTTTFNFPTQGGYKYAI